MLAYLIGILSGEVDVDVSPDYFCFKKKGQEKKFRAVIFVSAHGNPRILGVGDDQIMTEPNIRIDLFKGEDSTIRDNDKANYLEAFFRHCILMTYNRRALIRPRIVFRNSSSLKGILCGYQKLILENTALTAGARECVFKD
jgi:hypothetical protein